MTQQHDGTGAVDRMGYRELGDLAGVRSFVRSAALGRGLPAGRVELLMLAVSELAANTVEHTTGGGQVRLWRDGGDVVCEVADSGGPRTIRAMPAAASRRGRGLAIVQRVVDQVSTFAGPHGTVVQVRMAA
jgi:serine/threonine-protein kinase RsbW